MGSIGRQISGTFENITGINTGGDSAADQARRAQNAATAESNNTQLAMYNQQREDSKAWRAAGEEALTGLQNHDFQRDFTTADFQADPGYAFRMAEGQKAIERSAAARGGLNSGATLKALTTYSQGVASDEYNNAYNRFNADRDRRFNRLSSIAGVGQTANSQVAQAGQNYANQYGAAVTNQANANAASYMMQGNQMSNLIGQGLQAYGTYQGIKASDARVKKNIRRVPKEDLEELRQTIAPYMFNYISDEHGKGDWIGVMAQDLEKSKLGRSLLVTSPDGIKMVDMSKLHFAILALLAEG